MSVEENAAPVTGAETTVVAGPEEFSDYQRWRETGKLPEASADAGAGGKKPDGGEPKKADGEAGGEPVKSKEGQEKEGDTEGDGEGDAHKKKGGFQRKIEKLTRENQDLVTRLAHIEGRLAGNAGEAQGGKAAPAAAAAGGKPVPENFNTYDEYVEALSDWKTDQKLSARDAQARQKEIGTKWNERLTEARGRLTDFDETVDAELPITPAMQAVMLDSDLGADLAYWLGKHPEETERIAGLGPIAAAREMGKVEAQLARDAEAKEKIPDKPKPKASGAPKPVTPVGGGKGAPRLDGDMEFDAYERMRLAELSGR